MAGNFSDSQKQALTQQLRSVLMQTEHSGNPNFLYLYRLKSKLLNSTLGGFFYLLVALCANSATLDGAINEIACSQLTHVHHSYAQKIDRLMKLPEVHAWRKQVEANKRHVVTNPIGDRTSFHDNQCFWEISLYEDIGDQLLRSRAYQLAVNRDLILRVDFSEPDKFIPIQTLRK